MERKEVDVLDGEGVLVEDVLLAPALGLADMDPVGGLVTGSPEAVAFDEGLEEDGGEGVAVHPVLSDSPGGCGEEAGGEMLRADPGEDEEAGVVDDERKTGFADLSGPADPKVSGGDLPGGGPEAQAGQGRFPGPGDIADLGAREGLVAEVVVAVDEVVPEFAFETGPDRTQDKVRPSREGPVVDRSGVGPVGMADRPGTRRQACRALSPEGRKSEPTVPLHVEERRPTAHVLEGAVGLRPSEDPADPPREFRPVEGRILPDPGLDLKDLVGREVPARIADHPESWRGVRKRARRSKERDQGSQGERSEGACPSRAHSDR